MGTQLILGDYKEHLDDVLRKVKNPIIVTDPPFNIGYHYSGFKDKRPQEEYEREIACLLWKAPCVLVHYPEEICAFAIRSGIKPERIVSWVYNSNTAKQHRDIAYFGVTPDFRRVTQPYKNPKDKRIQALMAKGKMGGETVRLVERKPGQECGQRKDGAPLPNARRGHEKRSRNLAVGMHCNRPVHGQRDNRGGVPGTGNPVCRNRNRAGILRDSTREDEP